MVGNLYVRLHDDDDNDGVGGGWAHIDGGTAGDIVI